MRVLPIIPLPLLLLSTFILLCIPAQTAEPAKINSYAYVLQADKLADTKEGAVKLLRDCGRELIVIDPFYSPGVRWSKEDIADIRSGMPGRIIIAYLSIGEAETYRSYWRPEWNNPDTRPAFILDENPDWPGNFKVKFWDQDWQSLVFSQLKHIAQTGFDGVLLDIVDAFEYFETNPDGTLTDYKLNPDTGKSYRADMIDFIRSIKKKLDTYADKDFLIIPQNGTQLLESQPYQDTISYQAIENLFTNGDKVQPKEHSAYILSYLDSLINNGKGVLLTEYPTTDKTRKISEKEAKAHELTLLQTDRPLATLGKSDN